MPNTQLLPRIPKVDLFFQWLTAAGISGPKRLVDASVREFLDQCRKAILAGSITSETELTREVLVARFRHRLERQMVPNFRPVINATGVVIHTNLGRSRLPDAAMAAIDAVGRNYGNLEFDLVTGRRGSRYSLVEELICRLTGAEGALVVNNNAAAVLLVLETLAANREVIVSRGQLVEIGGSFRIPEVMAKSGARLVEVGATNRTHLRDYQQAIGDQTALLLKVHTSNYKIIGFTAEVPLADLVDLGRRCAVPVMEDLGSGCLLNLAPYGVGGEPTVAEVVATGVDVVTFSGDKLLGGPQAGIIVGRKALIDAIKKNPLNRALRIDKFTLAGLESVLRLYLDDDVARREIPTLALLTQPLAAIDRRARRLLRLVRKKLAAVCTVERVAVSSRVGGGAMPEQGLASRAVRLTPLTMSVNRLEIRLREQEVPVIGRIEQDCLLLDMRTVADRQIPLLAGSLAAALVDS